ncbi:TPA: hypothetical protein DEP94_02630 [Candidatus Nomurabacteria bacterium]|nr:hypothetical protein [Candidatus Nomurabacteria bacterium]
MKTANKILMAEARTALSDKWTFVIGVFVLSWLMSASNQIASILIAGAMSIGLATFSLALARNKTLKIMQIFSGFEIFWTSFKTFLLTTIFILLWAILLIIPGIIAALSYSQVYFILADNPKLKAMEAIEKSKKIMYGNKWKLFCLGLRFLGWIILSIITLGIGFLWTGPYMMVSYAKFYDDIKGGAEIAETK